MAADQETIYHGNCHCGRYRFQVSAPKDITGTTCNCSLCEKKGYIWLPAQKEAFRVVRDDGDLTEYQSASLADKFCSHCGTGVVGEHLAGPMRGQFAVNIRTILGVNPFELAVSKKYELDEPKLVAEPLPEPPASEPPAEEVVSCHCGKVRAELLIPFKEGQEVKEDNCSVCVRNAYIGVYPNKDQVRIHGRDNSFEYLTGPKYGATAHCKTCGVHVFTNIYGPKDISIFDTFPPEKKARVLAVYHANMKLQPLNVRAIEGIDLASIHWLERSDDGTEGYTLDP